MLPEDIIIAPVITEKSNDGMQEGKYTFEVSKKASQICMNRLAFRGIPYIIIYRPLIWRQEYERDAHEICC